MTDEQSEKYIELQRNLINELLKRVTNGKTMKELAAVMALQEFEESLGCNKDEMTNA